MNLSAILHQPLSAQAYGLQPNTIIMRLKAAKDDLDEVAFSHGDTAYQGHPVPFKTVLMNKIGSDNWHDYYECRLENIQPRLVYYFKLSKGSKTIYFTADRFSEDLPLERNDYYKFPYFLTSETIQIPSWYTRGVVYNIFLDSFNPKPLKEALPTEQRLGGNLESVIQKLDYFVDLGVTCLYFNPLFTAQAYHKYDTQDYHTIDPAFGDNEIFKHLVEKAHALGLKIVIDGVFNHAGEHFEPFQNWLKDPQGPYKDWFFQVKEPLVPTMQSGEHVSYACFGYEKHMPKLNLSNPAVQEYFLDVSTFWMKNYQIDGWRLDVADEAAPSFWRRFRNHVKALNPEAVLIGEVWQSAPSFMDGTLFDGLMNYDLLKHMKVFFTETKPNADLFAKALFQHIMRYREQHTQAQLNFLDSHDVPRFFTLINKNDERYRLAWVFLMTFIGVPMLFYGDEAPLEGMCENDYRRALTFKKPLRFRNFITDLIALRKRNSVLIDGRFKVSTLNEGSVLAYERFNNTERLIVILNLSEDDVIVPKGTVISSHLHNQTILKSNGYVILKEVDHGRDHSRCC